MNKKYDVCAIGNALVDYEIEVNDGFFEDHKIEKGLMTLVDRDRQLQLLTGMRGQIKKKQGGGSAANTIFGLSAFGSKGYYTCKVADDADGRFYVRDLTENGIDSNLSVQNLPKGTTGKCLVMISPDAERTMNTYLGVTTDFSKNELNVEAIKNSNYLFMEGFLVSSETGLEAMKEAKRIARENNVKVSLTFSDPSMVKYFRDQMISIVGDGVDLLFCNLEESELFTGVSGLETVKKEIRKVAEQFVITRSEKGAVIFDGDEFIDIKPFPTKAVDSTGAGDMFAGAYLYAINNDYDHKEAGILASAASSAVVSNFGPRLSKEHIEKFQLKTKN